jgi:L-erythro-3,5-diaminohexanoate dehydrogenase
LDTVKEKGKQQNPVTGSGGMFIGVVEKIGSFLKGKIDVREGDRIASLVSLSLTPLRIDKIRKIHKKSDQVDIEGKAILFERSVYTKLPEDINERLALALLDVAGAAPQTAKLVKPGNTVFILGAGGKSGMLCAYAARKRMGRSGKVIGTGHSKESTGRIKKLNLCDEVIQVDATRPLEVEKAVSELTDGKMADVTINCVSVPDTEMVSILATNVDGIVYFFNMATSFTKATLGAEGIGSDVTLIMGNGYTKNHAVLSLEILRESKELRKVFEELYT